MYQGKDGKMQAITMDVCRCGSGVRKVQGIRIEDRSTKYCIENGVAVKEKGRAMRDDRNGGVKEERLSRCE